MKENKELEKLAKKLKSMTYTKFPPSGPINVTDNQGVYLIAGSDKKVLHVGKTNRGKRGLTQRLRNHLNGHSSFVKNYVKKKKINLRMRCQYKYIEVDNARTRTLLEALLTGQLCPAYVGTGEKKHKV